MLERPIENVEKRRKKEKNVFFSREKENRPNQCIPCIQCVPMRIYCMEEREWNTKSRTNFQLSIGFAHTSTNALHQHMFERWWQVRSKNKTENTEHNQRVHFGVLIMRAWNIDLHLKIWSSALQANRTHIGLVWFFFLFETGIKWRCTKNSPHIHICTNECENPLLKHRSNASKCRRTAYMRSVFSK